jgi:uncharacterized OsmC-like protein
VEILTKQRTPPERFEIEVFATRRPEQPRRVMSLDVTFEIDGPRLEAAQVERAVALSIEKYCTVAPTLAGDIGMPTTVVLNGARLAPVKHAMFSATFPRA